MESSSSQMYLVGVDVRWSLYHFVCHVALQPASVTFTSDGKRHLSALTPNHHSLRDVNQFFCAILLCPVITYVSPSICTPPC